MKPAKSATAARKRMGACAFTLLEVMIAIGFIGIAMMGLLALHHQNLQSVVRARELTKAALLAQSVMTTAEVQRFPDLGTTQGNFSNVFKDDYSKFRWQRIVAPSPLFPDVRRVEVRVFYGPNFGQHFELIEFMHNPMGPEQLAPQMQGSGLRSAPPLGWSGSMGAWGHSQ